MKAVLFDLDGVLVDSYAVWHAVINAFARDHGYPPLGKELMDQGWGQGVDADAEMFFPGVAAEDLETYYERHFLDHLEALEVTPGAAAVLEGLSAIGCGTAVVTNTPHELTLRLLERIAFRPDYVIGTSRDVPAKPAPDMLLRACALLDVRPDEAFMIGDSPFDREAAAAAGVPFLSYRWDGGRRVDELEDLLTLAPDRELPELRLPDL